MREDSAGDGSIAALPWNRAVGDDLSKSKFDRALHGKFTAGWVYRGRELTNNVPFKNRTIFRKPTISTIITILYRCIFRKPYTFLPYTALNRGILQQLYTVPYTYHGHKQNSTAVIHPQWLWRRLLRVQCTMVVTMTSGCPSIIQIALYKYYT